MIRSAFLRLIGSLGDGAQPVSDQVDAEGGLRLHQFLEALPDHRVDDPSGVLSLAM